MNKLTIDQINDQQLVDIRNQEQFQEGHIEGSINLNTRNLLIYGPNLLKEYKNVVLITSKDESTQIDEIVKNAEKFGLDYISGYMIFEEIPPNILQTAPTISVQKYFEKTDDYVLLDVRQPGEITREAPKKNLVHIPLKSLAEDYNIIDKKAIVYTLCGSGNRATTASSFLSINGYDTVVIEGGMSAVEDYRNQ